MTILQESGPYALFFAFVIAHALADFPLQGDYLARMKCRNQSSQPMDWIIPLTAHALVQAGGVWIVSGSPQVAAIELGLHWLIDLAKGEGKFGYASDQALHLLCKLVYTILIAYGLLY